MSSAKFARATGRRSSRRSSSSACFGAPRTWRGRTARCVGATVRSLTVQPLVALPPKRYFEVECPLDPAARKLYDELELAVKNRVRLIVRAEGDNAFSESASALSTRSAAMLRQSALTHQS